MLIKQNTKRTGKTNGLDFHVSPRLQQATIVFFFYSRASKYVKNIYPPPTSQYFLLHLSVVVIQEPLCSEVLEEGHGQDGLVHKQDVGVTDRVGNDFLSTEMIPLQAGTLKR